jgi:hypothetical protein
MVQSDTLSRRQGCIARQPFHQFIGHRTKGENPEWKRIGFGR